ncbi:MAG: bifunctional diaminohydroxyphosphoribosylaminopyrimidine deaminase/5-amino-6-(5-phosphoribosylamino)uracil reductase RibD [Bacteroidia bacterium]|nr:bifunctional diaminohydroxyphosphoribosylaminopyrimidine deaminase/5-amino-6-(5-phosphoribosylamino)uracil reductase RibD [Bacteroidia bacterium]
MHRCLELAQSASADAHPNPMVGAVVVHNDVVIGEGFHQAYGQPHAEVNAILNVENADMLRESTLYVNLEPCSHYGKTPPCADLIIAREIPKVVIAHTDPHDKVAGNGIKKLMDAGIDVTLGVLEKEAEHLNRAFITHHKLKRPYVVLKWAETSDGFIGRLSNDKNQDPQISGQLASNYTHKLRAESGAILVGTNTALLDNPSLTTRNWPGRNPLRVILDRKARIPMSHKLFQDRYPALVLGPKRSGAPNSVEFLEVGAKQEVIPTLLNHLHTLGILQLMVEGGAELIQQFIDTNTWDECHRIIAPTNWDNGVEAPSLSNIEPTKEFQLGLDLINVYSR